MTARHIDSPPDASRGAYQSTWVLVSGNAAFFERPEIAFVAKPIANMRGVRAWTDDYSSLLPILEWQRR
jgi:hypothetical protein